jgi:hypothetical protein
MRPTSLDRQLVGESLGGGSCSHPRWTLRTRRDVVGMIGSWKWQRRLAGGPVRNCRCGVDLRLRV